MKNNKSLVLNVTEGFTLVEILVVIAVLAGMMALLVPNFMTIREKTRDVKRKNDLQSIQKALELYAQNQTPHLFPTSLPTPCMQFTDSNANLYMAKFPLDPLVTCTGATSRYYYAQPTPGDYFGYSIGACLENKNDSEAIDCPTGFNSNTNTTCSSAKCYILSSQ